MYGIASILPPENQENENEEIPGQNTPVIESVVTQSFNDDLLQHHKRTNELLTMIVYLLLVFFIYFALHRFQQAKRRK